MKYDKTSIRDVERYGKELIGKTFLEVLKDQNFESAIFEAYCEKYSNPSKKDNLVNLLEEIYFGFPCKSAILPDENEIPIVLKVFPYEITKKRKLHTEERLDIALIDYSVPVEEDFYFSHLWKQAQKILLIYYQQNKTDRNILECPIGFVSLFSPSEEDKKIISSDYNKIISKISVGKGHELSESDTMYLAACKTGSSAEKNTIPQTYYNPSVPAIQRTFGLKASYMNGILKEMVAKTKKTEKILLNSRILQNMTMEEYILRQLHPYKGQSDEELCKLFGRPYDNHKSQWIDLTYRMLNIKANWAMEFAKANVVVKSIRLEENNKAKEHISFPTFRFKEIIEEEWDTSYVCRYFEETKFLFVIYKRMGKRYYFNHAMFWNIPAADLYSYVKQCWLDTVQVIGEGVKFTIIGSMVYNNLPAQRQNPVMHVHPLSQNSAYRFEDGTEIGNIKRDAYELPDGRYMTKQCFWLNKSYVLDQIRASLLE